MVDFHADIEQCLAVLHAGGTILYPTDTVWGLGCDATNTDAVNKIFRIKQRPDEKALIVLAADERMVMQHVAAADLAVFDYLQKASKPTTVIYDGAIGLADNLVAKDGSVAIRICNELFCKHLLKRFRRPLVSTSANISGQPVARIFGEIAPAIVHAADYVVKYRQEDETIAEPSSIIKWENGNIVVLRP